MSKIDQIRMKHILEMAIAISIEAHAGQKYGEHDYHSYHVCDVVETVTSQADKSIDDGLTTEDMKTRYDLIVVAYLHDVLEDSSWTANNLRESGIPEDIIEAVVLLTKDENTVIEKYIDDIKKNPIARAVKIADMTCNMKNCIKEFRANKFSKYAKQLATLLGK